MRVSAILCFIFFILDAVTSLTDHGAKTLSHGAFFCRSGGSGTTTTHRSDESSERERKPYIVYMGDAPETGTPALGHHHNLLVNAIGEERIARESMIHSYGKSFNAFAATLLPHEAERLKDMEGVVSVFPSKIHKLDTTRSWDFLGMPTTVKRNPLLENDIIVGVLDSGIYMQSESFNDKGYGPPPFKWKGKCQTGPEFPGCNKEIEILQAFDDAINDGVDVLSISITGTPKKYYESAIAIGSFHAMTKGIFTACAAGNLGPAEYSVSNGAPWIMTVAANTIDRLFKTDMKLGNGLMASGTTTINTFSPEKSSYPLTSRTLARLPDFGTLDASMVKGKILYCYEGDPYTAGELQAAGIINTLYQDEAVDFASDYALPAVFVDANLDAEIERYINTNKDPHAIIYKTYDQKQPTAPFLASFSSRGPNLISGTILKPDISAPGVEILASWTLLAHPTTTNYDKRYGPYNMKFGTSMACPHVAAAAAYIKSFHPSWSPAAIKSALITTARALNPNPQAPTIGDHLEGLGYGAGQIDPVSAVNPGLVYDFDQSSYISFLCKEGYNDETLELLVMSKGLSCKGLKAAGYDGLNYPSMNINLDRNQPISAMFKRTVTNVGDPNSVYKATVMTPPGLSVKVIPDTLNFNTRYKKKTFKVVIKGPAIKGSDSRILQASLEWNDKLHKVRSPILVYRRGTKFAR